LFTDEPVLLSSSQKGTVFLSLVPRQTWPLIEAIRRTSSSLRLTEGPVLQSNSQKEPFSSDLFTDEPVLLSSSQKEPFSSVLFTDGHVLQYGNLVNQLATVKLTEELVLHPLRLTDEPVLQSNSQKEPVFLSPVHR
jgi:hypothetical protein